MVDSLSFSGKASNHCEILPYTWSLSSTLLCFGFFIAVITAENVKILLIHVFNDYTPPPQDISLTEPPCAQHQQSAGHVADAQWAGTELMSKNTQEYDAMSKPRK